LAGRVPEPTASQEAERQDYQEIENEYGGAGDHQWPPKRKAAIPNEAGMAAMGLT